MNEYPEASSIWSSHVDNNPSSNNREIADQLTAQQQQIEQLAAAVGHLAESIAQRPIPDYQPLLNEVKSRLKQVGENYQQLQLEIDSKLKQVGENYQQLQLEIEQRNSGEQLAELEQRYAELQLAMQQIRQSLKKQNHSLGRYLGWKIMVVNIGITGLLAGAITIAGLYFLPSAENTALRQKLDKVDIRTEQIWKQVKRK